MPSRRSSRSAASAARRRRAGLRRTGRLGWSSSPDRRAKNRARASLLVQRVPPIWMLSSTTPLHPFVVHRYKQLTCGFLPRRRAGSNLGAAFRETIVSVNGSIILTTVRKGLKRITNSCDNGRRWNRRRLRAVPGCCRGGKGNASGQSQGGVGEVGSRSHTKPSPFPSARKWMPDSRLLRESMVSCRRV